MNDNNILFECIISGGVVGGLVTLLDKSFDRAKWAIPAGVLLGITLDYWFKKAVKEQNIEITKTYIQKLWDNTLDLLPETNDYWSTITSGLTVITTIVMSTYGFKAIVGQFTTAAIAPDLLRVSDSFPDVPNSEISDTIPDRWHEPGGGAHVPRPVDISKYAGQNPISAIIAPTTLQLIGAFSGKRLVRRAGAELAFSIIWQAIRSSGFEKKLIDLVGKGAVAISTELPKIISKFRNTLVEGISVRQDDMYLTNERLLLLQSPDGRAAYSLLQNGSGQIEAVPAVRLPLSEWQNLQNNLASRLNLTPLDTGNLPNVPQLQPNLSDIILKSGDRFNAEELLDELDASGIHDEKIDDLIRTGASELSADLQAEFDRSMTLADLDMPAGIDTRTFDQMVDDVDRESKLAKLDKEWDDGVEFRPNTPETTMSDPGSIMQPPSITTTISNHLDTVVDGARGRTLRELVINVAYSGVIPDDIDFSQSIVDTVRDIDANTLLSAPSTATMNSWYQTTRSDRMILINQPIPEYGGRTLRDLVHSTISDTPLPEVGGFNTDQMHRRELIEASMKTMFKNMMKVPAGMRDTLQVQLALFDEQLIDLGGTTFLDTLRRQWDEYSSDEDQPPLVPDSTLIESGFD